MDINELSPSDIEKITDAIANGATISEACNMSQESLEAAYALAYNLYNAGNYTDAVTLFKALCIYSHMEEKFWIGLAGSLQGLERYAEAIENYSAAAVASGLNNPVPLYQAALCHLKLGNKDDAIGTLKGLQAILNKEEHPDFIIKINSLLSSLEINGGHSESN